ncbi:DUF1853 family protein [Massilia pseudoviolaceinigra]|uniref:DUF1853 family protein n=1 Tax=Massilia pseudoviolaceinigra TaxID=3057165 RepID=UPI002796B6F4|nr:DUF1853 family protein [Massilia sp. CCM 9206]MDQ1920193.1 DUF1853 family protein [Massilia sp. CCM 9206]
MAGTAENYQAGFERRWGQLEQPHVRALAWLLHAPDLLDPADPHWEGKIATLGELPAAVDEWLLRLDSNPAPLLEALGTRNYTRLGLYAEKLMAFYFQEHGLLVAHGLQVRASRNDTVGEFDFLLDHGDGGLEHIEFATKFYLLEGEAASRFDTFVGPNLADSLGAKMRKIFERQLALGTHPAAQAVLPRPVTRARALVKGWLFYPGGAGQAMDGISGQHCRGFWCALDDVAALEPDAFVVLPRLQWLAPFRSLDGAGLLSREHLQATLADKFGTVPMPVLVASVRAAAGGLVETGRGFIVPNDWRVRAAFRQQMIGQPA